MLAREELRRSARSLLLPLAIAVVVDAAFYTGYLASDDNGYLSTAHQVLHGQPMTPYVGSVRLGMMIPLLCLYWLTSGRVHLIAALFALLHPLLVILAHGLGRLAHGFTVARVAALLVACCPFLYVFAGAILPDLITTTWIMLSLISLILGVQRRALPWIAASGIALGFGYATKETALVMLVPAVGSLILSAPRERRFWIAGAATIALGVVLVMGVETLLLRALTGEWITHLGELENNRGQLAEFAQSQGGVGPWIRFKRTFMELKDIGPLWIWMLVISSVVYSSVADRCLPLFFFTTWCFAYLTWGTTSLSAYTPPPIQPRYYAIVLVPATVVIARAMLALAKRLSVRVAISLFAVGIGTLFIGEIVRNRHRAGDIYGARFARGMEEAYRSAALARPELPVVLSPSYGWMLDGMFLEDRPNHLISLHRWESKECPKPPFLWIELGHEHQDAKLRALVGEPVKISTLDILYPRPRLERLWEGLADFFVVGPRPPRGTWYWHMQETVLLLVEPGEATSSRDRDWAPIYPDPPLTVLHVPGGHVIAWPGGLRRSIEMQLFDQRDLHHPPTHEASLVEATRALCVELDYRALAGNVAMVTTLHTYGRDDEPIAHESTARSLAESSSVTVSLQALSQEPMQRFRISFKLSPPETAGRLQIGAPRIVPCDE